MVSTQHTQVLVVGGGLVGLSAAVFLSWFGVDTVIVERRASNSPHPRSRGVNPRTMELLRQVRLEDQVRATASARALVHNSGIMVAESLAGRQIGALVEPYFGDSDADYTDVSPCQWCMCHQDELEPLLRRRAEELGGRVHFSHELVDLDQDGDQVRACIRTPAGEVREIRADYLIAADGAESWIRERLDITRAGVGSVAQFMNIDFEADLAAILGERRFIMCYVTAAGTRAALLPVDNASRWMLHVSLDPDSAAENGADQRGTFTRQRCVDLVRAAVGVADLDVDVREVLPWESAGLTATRWRQGRCFLAGDAAHVMPPSGAFGSNTGIQDTHNLAWKLSMVLAGQADPTLLDTYEQERRPVAERTVHQAVLRARDRPRLVQPGSAPVSATHDADIRPDAVVIFGYRYSSAAVIAERPERAGDWAHPLDGAPGTRAPHGGDSGSSVSILDSFGRDFVLVIGAAGAIWRAAAQSAVRRTGVTLTVRSGDGSRYGISPAGAALVRPDGFVAWRAWRPPRDPREALVAVLSRVLCRGPGPSVERALNG